MKNTFSGYYQPSTEQYELLWNDALIVLDTNVLLSLYRLPTTAREDVLRVLGLLKERLWIPHQVALEFQRRRLTVIASARKGTDETLNSANTMVADIKSKVETLQIEKRGLNIEPQPLLDELDKASAKLMEAIEAAHNAQLDISTTDTIRQSLDELLEGKVGKGPTDQDELNELIKDGEHRYSDRIPPGFADNDKDKNPNEANFIFDHIKFPRKFGDLILWKQLIRHTKESNIDKVLFITEDRKDDWWWREQGKVVGPQPELIREISRDGGVKLFWMYSSSQFVEHANKYYAAAVPTESVDEIKQVAESENTLSVVEELYPAKLSPLPSITDASLAGRYGLYASELFNADVAFLNWLRNNNEPVHRNFDSFPEYYIEYSYGHHGYEFKLISDFYKVSSPDIANNMLRGYMEVHEGRLSKFTQVICMVQENVEILLKSKSTSTIEAKLQSLLQKYPISEIIFAAIVKDRLVPIIVIDNQ